MEESTLSLLNEKIGNELIEEILMIHQKNCGYIQDQFFSLSQLKEFVPFNSKWKQPSILNIIKADLKFRIFHAIHIYKSNSIYTYIPKNACSTMRYSVALNNGFIQEEEQLKWISVNANTVAISVKNLSSLLNPNYSFVILRCPYSRLVSVFFDKFINKRSHANKFMEKHMPNQNIDDMSFQEFIKRIGEMRPRNFDHHWRPQTHFLLYKEYTRYFALEDLGSASKILEQDIGFKVHDTRNKLNHHTSNIRTIVNIQEPWNLSIKELRELPNLPLVKSMFNNELIKKVKSIYNEDIEFYSSKFGKNNLSFS